MRREGREIQNHREANHYTARAANIDYLHHEKHLWYFAIDARGRIVSMNHLLAVYLGYDCKELVGKSVGVLIHSNDLDVDDFDNRDSGTARRLIIRRVDRSEFLANCFLHIMDERERGKVLLLIIESIIDMIPN